MGFTSTLKILPVMYKVHLAKYIYIKKYVYTYTSRMTYCDVAVTVTAPDQLVDGVSSCPTPGCNGIGHIKGAKYTGHHRYLYSCHQMSFKLPSFLSGSRICWFKVA